MRLVINTQANLDEIDISAISLDIKSRDAMVKVLRGLQYIWVNKKLREQILNLLASKIKLSNSKMMLGRKGICLWNIFVMAVVRTSLNMDYDLLHDQVNNHRSLRQILGHGEIFDNHQYSLQAIKDNMKLLNVELLAEINQLVVKAGHQALNKEGNPLKTRCDSFVCKRNVEYPTDLNLLLDAERKVINVTRELSEKYNIEGWRQGQYNYKKLKKLMRAAQASKKGGTKTEKQKNSKEEKIISAHEEYITLASKYIEKACKTLELIETRSPTDEIKKCLIDKYISDAKRQIDQIKRRVIDGEVIPHDEKIFSIFERDTEFVVKGKAGIPVELGIKVCVIEDQHQFILHHQVMRKESDNQVAVPMISATKKRYSNLETCSFDKGFHSPENQERLAKELKVVALPRKGKLSKKNQELQSEDRWCKARKGHSGIESCINGLQVSALDKCPDKGVKNFDLYVAAAVVSRNLHRLGSILIKKERQKERKLKRRTVKLAA